jgi:hypothetical protein
LWRAELEPWLLIFVDDLLFLPTISTLDLLRLRLVCDDEFFFSRLVAEVSRERLRSDVARRWPLTAADGAIGGKAKARSGDGDACRLVSLADEVEP